MKALQRPQQKQSLSPKMFGAMRILSLDARALEEEIERKVEENPALEAPTGEPYEAPRAESFASSSKISPDDAMENTPAEEISLHETLLQRLVWENRDENEITLAKKIINNLNDNGFHKENPALLCENDAETMALPKILALIRSFSPEGCACTGPIESLTEQARLRPFSPDFIVDALPDALKALEKSRLEEALTLTGLEPTDLEEFMAYLKSLNPYPGLSVGPRETAYVRADLFVTVEGTEVSLQFNERAFAEPTINPFFRELIEDKASPDDAKTYARLRMREALDFLDAVHMRKKTLYQVGLAIVNRQKSYFLLGSRYLKPLAMREIALETGLHETTVGRAVAGKYLQTPFGLEPLKSLFSNALPGAKGPVSGETVKAMIKQILGEFSGKKRPSDEKIAAMLRSNGITIARRTVSKYRNELAYS